MQYERCEGDANVSRLLLIVTNDVSWREESIKCLVFPAGGAAVHSNQVKEETTFHTVTHVHGPIQSNCC